MSLKCKQKQYKDVYFSNWEMSQNDPNDECNNLLLQTDSNLRGSLHEMVSSSFSKPLNGSFFFLCYNIFKTILDLSWLQGLLLGNYEFLLDKQK